MGGVHIDQKIEIWYLQIFTIMQRVPVYNQFTKSWARSKQGCTNPRHLVTWMT